MTKNYVCHLPCLRSHNIIWLSFMVQVCKMIISPGIFSMLQFWFSRLSRGWKGKKWPKMSKISVRRTLYFRNHISYDLHLWYTYMYKRVISPGILFIFFMVKGGKNGLKWQKLLSHSVSQDCTSYDYDFWYRCVNWWYLQQIVSFFKILIFGVFRGVKWQKMT